MFQFIHNYSPFKRLYKFVLKRVLGNFLKTELDLEQLDVQLGAGVLELRDLELNVHVSLGHAQPKFLFFSSLCSFIIRPQVLNELLMGSPLRVTSGYINVVRATIPWKNIFSQNCKLEIDGFELHVVPSEGAPGVDLSVSISDLCKSSMLEASKKDIDPEELKKTIDLHKQLQDQLRQASAGESEDPYDDDEIEDEGLQVTLLSYCIYISPSVCVSARTCADFVLCGITGGSIFSRADCVPH